MGKPTRNDARQDKVLSNLSIAYQNEDYIANRLMPPVDVKNERAGTYYVFNKDKFRRPVNDLRAAGSEANLIDYALTTATYGPITEKALAQKVEQELIDEADKVLDPLRNANENVTERLLVGKENRLATFMQNTANLTNNTTLSGTSQWSDFANSDPIDDVETAKASVHTNIIKHPNTLVLGKEVFDKLRNHPDILDRIKWSERGNVTLGVLAEVFNVKNVILAEAAYNTTREGQSESISYLWGKHAWLLYINPASRPTKESISFGYTFTMNLAKGGRITDKWYSKPMLSWFVRSREAYEQKLVSTGAAYLIKNVIA